MYSSFFTIAIACVVLKLLLSRYRYQLFLMSQKGLFLCDILRTLRIIKYNIFVLKDTVITFNDVFGWTILFSMFFGLTRTFLYCDRLIKGSSFALNYQSMFFSQTRLIGLTSIPSTEEKKLQCHVYMFHHNRPEFTMANFFSINRSSIFLNCVITFLVVVLQINLD
ncbi:hypothetical protein BDFB_012720 [Asbolus verrucosus]|uniref:7tm 7 domain containing protein n=1 Tax=Asbolus verrucosus TaxID=1661398 RepID=A0A482VQI8_ASBVE|nr:hypothetical protein BDFB_012720 [Asbolus verrucosus]